MNLLSLLSKNEESCLTHAHYDEGQTVFKEGDECRGIGIVLSGAVKIVSYSLLGNEIVFNTVRKDHVFGNNLLFSSSPFYKGDVVALSDTNIAYIEKKDLLEILRHNDAFLLNYLQMQSNFGIALNSKIKLLSIASAKERLLYLLEDNGGTYTYDTVTSLALEMNLERETLSRTISSLVQEKTLIKEGKTLKIRP